MTQLVRDASDWIAQTKLHPPLVRADVIVRPRLLAALDRALAALPVTLISAPAGSGKTTLMSAWLRRPGSEPEQGGHAARDEAPVLSPHRLAARTAWLALDGDDNDPARFLLALVGALRRIAPGCGATVAALLRAGDGGPVDARRLAGILVNDILEALPDPFVLVLDDLHVLDDAAIYAALEYLIERIPPQMRLVILSRHDPPLGLARLRARRQVRELRLDDLRFTVDETERLLNDALRLDLSADSLRLLHARTEGWAAGISLLAGSLDRLPSAGDRQAFLEHLDGTSRDVFDFLAEEVLGRQDPFVRMFLLETAILPDLTPAACQAVTGRADSAAILDDLYRRNLFLVALEGAERQAHDQPAPLEGAATVRPTYRYHDLFRDFLRARLARELPEWVRQLHARAGAAETLPSRRIHHYLAAERWDAAAEVIEQVGEVMLAHSGARTLRAWIGALPDAVQAGRPRLLYLLGVCARTGLEWDRAQLLFERARVGFAAQGNAAGEADTLAQLGTLLLFMGYRAESLTAVRGALAAPIAPHQRTQLLLVRAWLELGDNRYEQALADMDAALAVAASSDDPRVFGAFALLIHSPLSVVPGALARFDRLEQLVNASLGGRGGLLDAMRLSFSALAWFWRGRWDTAVVNAARVLALGEQFGGLAWGDTPMRATLALYAAYRGDIDEAERAFAALFAALTQIGAPYAKYTWIRFYRIVYARVCWLRGDVEAARAVAAAIADDESPAGRWTPLLVGRPLLEGMLRMAEGDYQAAERAIKAAGAEQRQDSTTLLIGRADVLLAHLYRVSGRPAEALAAIEPLLVECEREGAFGWLFWDGPLMMAPLLRLAIAHGAHAALAARALALMDELGFLVGERRFVEQTGTTGARPQAAPALDEPLTAREIEILELLAAGASNQAIAARLVISLHTVKRHVTHIHQKLGVASRLEAVARARALGLVA
jgi:LuxR family maltose regulon positive regulatory protein